jgi:taurine dioxygenase
MTTTLDTATATDESTRFGIRLLAGRLGAELTGIDAANPTDESVAFVRTALLKHRVVFLRDQRLDYNSQVAFAQRFGSLTLGHPTIPSPSGQPLRRDRLAQGRSGQQVAHRRHLRRPAAGVHVPARRDHSSRRRRHGLGQHGVGL